MELSKNKKVVIVTSGQPSLNPRLVKEADTLSNAGYDVTVLYAYWNNWGKKLDERILATRPWKGICVGGDPATHRSTYFLSRLIYRVAKFITKKIGFTQYVADIAISRSSFFLLRKVQNYKADLYIAHNLGALPAIMKAASKYKAKTGFDAEDYHRQEIGDDTRSYNYRLAEVIEDKYLQRTSYVTASSPQISDAYTQVYPDIHPVTILNVFPVDNAVKLHASTKIHPIRLFWFSQTVGVSRGLNDIAKALSILNIQDFELHLLGYISEHDRQEFIDNELSGIRNVHFHEPIAQEKLTQFASQFDIGLALEPGFCLNNNIALSNKLFTYLQAGLAIIASNTTAQAWFMNKYPNAGSLYPINDTSSLAALLTEYKSDLQRLSDTRAASLRIGREELNWENERVKFLGIINQTLQSN